MHNQSSPGPVSNKRKSRTAGMSYVGACLALLLLFLWLQLILALQIEVTGRKIQASTVELEETRRRIMDVERAIAAARSQHSLADRAEELGYQPQTPIYLLLSGPLSEPSSMGEGQTGTPSAASDQESPALQSLSLWTTVARRLDTMTATAQDTMP
jgi:hypothetical protein